jgi:hypothetical protein
MDGRVKSLDGNRYGQVFSIGTFFAEISQIERKKDAGLVLKAFVLELGVHEELTIDGRKSRQSPEQNV